MSWLTVVASLIAAILGTGGTAAIIQAVARRRPTKVEAVDRLNESTLEWAEQLKADARDARADAREARQEAADSRRAALDAQREATESRRAALEAQRDAAESSRRVAELAEEVRALHAAIYDPNASIERLRQAISANGRPPH